MNFADQTSQKIYFIALSDFGYCHVYCLETFMYLIFWPQNWQCVSCNSIKMLFVEGIKGVVLTAFCCIINDVVSSIITPLCCYLSHFHSVERNKSDLEKLQFSNNALCSAIP